MANVGCGKIACALALHIERSRVHRKISSAQKGLRHVYRSRSQPIVGRSFPFLAASAMGQNSSPPGMMPTPEDSDNVVREPSYLPHSGRNIPANVDVETALTIPKGRLPSRMPLGTF